MTCRACAYFRKDINSFFGNCIAKETRRRTCDPICKQFSEVKSTNADRIRAMSNDDLCDAIRWLGNQMILESDGEIYFEVSDWLKREVEQMPEYKFTWAIKIEDCWDCPFQEWDAGRTCNLLGAYVCPIKHHRPSECPLQEVE